MVLDRYDAYGFNFNMKEADTDMKIDVAEYVLVNGG